MTAPALQVEGLVKRFPVRRRLPFAARRHVDAVSGVDLVVERGRTLGLVGESGSGKSTVAQLVTRLVEPTAGRIEIDGVDVGRLRGAGLREVRRHVQLVFQDPYSSFDPLSTIGRSIAEPLRTHVGGPTARHAARVAELLDLVGLSSGHGERLPAQLSGGQLQRAAIARALAVEPQLLVLDEPVTALDVSTQAQVVNLVSDLQQRLGIALLFIAHDLSVVRHVSHDVAVMHMGRVVEQGPAEEVYRAPRHPYTAGLLAAVPVPDPVRQRARPRPAVGGENPSPIHPPSGCRFRTRCPAAEDVCAATAPEPTTDPHGVTVRCHLPLLDGVAVGGNA